MPADPQVTGAEALQRLLAGNERFAAGGGRARRHRPELATAPTPLAVVLACADSRVAPEIVLDQDLGVVFAVRAAGNTAEEPALLGSIEYGVAVLGAPLVLVMGHDGCLAVAAALEGDGGPAAPGRIPAVVAPIKEALGKAGAGGPGIDAVADRLRGAVRENVRHQAARLAASGPVLAPAVVAGRLVVAGACYSPVDGRVELLTPTASR
ncbi:MAG TPA: carbonic anhydrase [Acidimicrobiales bacterium]|nr:carbonic anhydrase [Acidimicrobiales bacterium]